MHNPAAIFSDQIGSVPLKTANPRRELSETPILLEDAEPNPDFSLCKSKLCIQKHLGNMLAMMKSDKNMQISKPKWKELVDKATILGKNTTKELEFRRKSLGREGALEEFYTGNNSVFALISNYKRFLANNESYGSTNIWQIRLPTDILERTTLLLDYLDSLPHNSLFFSPLFCILSHIKFLFQLICRTNSYQVFCFFKDRAECLLFALISIVEQKQAIEAKLVIEAKKLSEFEVEIIKIEAKLKELEEKVIMEMKEYEQFLQRLLLAILPHFNEKSNQTTKNLSTVLYHSNSQPTVPTHLSSSLRPSVFQTRPPIASHPLLKVSQRQQGPYCKTYSSKATKRLSYLKTEGKDEEFGEMQRKDGQKWEWRGNVEERMREMKRGFERKEKESRDYSAVMIIYLRKIGKVTLCSV